MTILAVIPARYDSSRFPGKPLADRTGKPMIAHVIDQVRKANRIDRIIVATDDLRIAEAVQAHGGEAVMTRPDHANGTSRIAEVVANLDASESQIIVNVQGDEPEIEPHVIDQLVDGLLADTESPMATLAGPFTETENPADPNIVKVVVDQNGRAMYFSRSLIPYVRDAAPPTPPSPPIYLKHPGLYAYRRDFLLEYINLEPTPLEQIEKLEQLRVLEHGHTIAVIQTAVTHHGIDTPEQYEAFVSRKRKQST